MCYLGPFLVDFIFRLGTTKLDSSLSDKISIVPLLKADIGLALEISQMISSGKHWPTLSEGRLRWVLFK